MRRERGSGDPVVGHLRRCRVAFRMGDRKPTVKPMHRCPTGWHVVPQVWCRTKHDCHCDGCVADYRRHWREKQRRLGGWGVRDPEDASTVRAQLQMLREAGWGVGALADACGVHRHTVRWLLDGTQRRASVRVRESVDGLWRRWLDRQQVPAS